MRVAVTGAAGSLGTAVVVRLLERGFEVVGVDIRPLSATGVREIRADLCDLGHVYGALAGVEAVIHLGAIAAPVGRPPERVYGNNVLSTFNIFEAAASLGIRRVVYASSASALGFAWQHRWSEPRYLPLDESHPLLPQDCYGLSKAQGEANAAAYCRRTGASAASLRFPSILNENSYVQLTAAVQNDPRAYAHLLWSYVDLRDAAEACLLALAAPFDGHQPLFITAADTLSTLPSATLAERFFPTVPRHALPARCSLLKIDRAAIVIGYQPHYSWHTVLEGLQGDMQEHEPQSA
jgi:nucleoside-diphosphate-sugar epimerase